MPTLHLDLDDQDFQSWNNYAQSARLPLEAMAIHAIHRYVQTDGAGQRASDLATREISVRLHELAQRESGDRKRGRPAKSSPVSEPAVAPDIQDTMPAPATITPDFDPDQDVASILEDISPLD